MATSLKILWILLFTSRINSQEFVAGPPLNDLLPLYQNDNTRYEQRSEALTNLQEKKLLAYLYTATQSKISTITQNKDANLIINTRAFLKTAVRNIQELKNVQIDQLNTNYTLDYKKSIEDKIGEASELTGVVARGIEGDFEEVSGVIDGLLEEIKELEGQAEEDKAQLAKAHAQLKKSMQAQTTLGIFKGVFDAFNFVLPVGDLIGGVLGGVSSSMDMGEPPGPMVLPEGIVELNEKGEKLLEKMCKGRLRAMREQLGRLVQAEDVTSEDLPFIEEVHSVLEEIDFLLASPPDYEKVIEMKERILVLLKRKRFFGDLIEGVGKLIAMPFEVYEQHKGNQEKLDALAAAMDQADENLEKLREYEDNVLKTLVPMLLMMQQDLLGVVEGAQGGSTSKIEVTKWEVARTLREVAHFMEGFTEGLQIQKEFAYTMDKLEESVVTLVGIYQNIQDYQEQKTFADYLAHISSPTSLSIGVSGELKRVLLELEVAIRNNVILGQYERAAKAFKQLVFPFAESYLEQLELPAVLEDGDLVGAASGKLEALRGMLEEYDYQPVPEDEHVTTGMFCSDCDSGKPFFTWGKEEHGAVIGELLRGGTVYLAADVGGSLNAVKFQSLEVKFVGRNASVQEEINKRLRSFRVELTHTGNSYYRCDRDVYVIPGQGLLIRMSFERRPDGEPMEANEVYRKIRNGDVMLSPYALWKVKLVDHARAGFGVLEEFVGEVDVSLEGEGRYVWRESKVCDGDLERFYNKI